MHVQQILRSKSDDGVVTVPPGTSLAKAAEILSSRRIGALIVSPDGKRVAGILSERDVVRELHLVGDDEHGQAALREVLDHLHHVIPHLGIECAGRLVEQHHLG